jgi:arsenate reductase
MDSVITVCSNAAGENCPLWSGYPITAHWDIHDPAAHDGTNSEKREAFTIAYRTLEQRIRVLINQMGEK